MLKNRNSFVLVPALLLLTAATGCGTQSFGKHPGSLGVNAGADTITTTTANPPATLTGTPALSLRVGAVGYNSGTVTVNTGSILKVKFTPGKQDEKISSSGATPIYSTLGVYIQVGSRSQPTPLLSNGYSNPATSSGVMDFAGAFTSTCQAGVSTCRQAVTITVAQPNGDDYCWANWSQPCLGYYSHQLDGHPWHGTLTVQTDDTDSI